MLSCVIIILTIIYIVEFNRQQSKINQELELERAKSQQLIDSIKVELNDKSLKF